MAGSPKDAQHNSQQIFGGIDNQFGQGSADVGQIPTGNPAGGGGGEVWMTNGKGGGRFVPFNYVAAYQSVGWTVGNEVNPSQTALGGMNFGQVGPIGGNVHTGGLPLDTVIWTRNNGEVMTFQNAQSTLSTIANQGGYTGRGLPGQLEADFIGGTYHRLLVMDLNNWENGTQGEQDDVLTQADIDAALLAAFGAAAGGGGGGRRIGPVFQALDEEQVREVVQTYVVATTGKLDPNLVDEGVGVYLKAHRTNFDDPTQTTDPVTSVQTLIRGSAVYKDVHKLRPESASELEWVTSQQGHLRSLGLDAMAAEQAGIDAARVGSSQEATQELGERTFLQNTGRIHADQRESLKQSTRAALRLL